MLAVAVGKEKSDDEGLLVEKKFGEAVHLYSTGAGGSGVTEQSSCTEFTV